MLSADPPVREEEDAVLPPPRLPRVVIAGRPNVGKSTLFNRLARRRLALTADRPGLTRDWLEARVEFAGRRAVLVDTAGLDDTPEDTIGARQWERALLPLAEADLILFVIDAAHGLSPLDHHFARWLRRLGRPVRLVANKAETAPARAVAAEAFRLGFGPPLLVSAEHGEGIAALREAVAEALGPGEDESGGERVSPHEAGEAATEEAPPGGRGTEAEAVLRLAILGRPNVGKSSLANALFGSERLLAGPEPGLTRDPVRLELTDAEGMIELVDTAGVRRRARITDPLEKRVVQTTLATLRSADVVLLAVDASEGTFHDQDLRLAERIEEEGRALVVGLTKWDLVTAPKPLLARFQAEAEAKLPQFRGVTLLPLSVHDRTGLDRLFPAVRAAKSIWERRVPTSALNRWLETALARNPPPLLAGRRLKLRYITQAGTAPPSFVLFGGRADRLPEAYRRYLINGLRETFGLFGTPIRLTLRASENPYATRKKKG
jgi:GTP-binding protein